jgi:hypothetical protein
MALIANLPGGASLSERGELPHTRTIVITMVAVLMATLLMMPGMAHAQDTYQLYDTRLRDQQVTVNKIWDDEYSLDSGYWNREYREEVRARDHENLSIGISTKVPQESTKTYAIQMDANGGDFGTNSAGNAITTNTLTFNAKGSMTSGRYATPSRDGYTFFGWSTQPDAKPQIDANNANLSIDIVLDAYRKYSIRITTFDTQANEMLASLGSACSFALITGTDGTKANPSTSEDLDPYAEYNYYSYDVNWAARHPDKSVTKVYAVWKPDTSYHYAVMLYGIDANGTTKYDSGTRYPLVFGPALGYPEFSEYKDGTYDATDTLALTRHHVVAGNAAIMSEDVDACTDTSHSVITGADAGTTPVIKNWAGDVVGGKNPYRCLHYDNWNTIIYWCKTDPHVYDKCLKNGCSKSVPITPTDASIQNGVFNPSESEIQASHHGDGLPYVIRYGVWDAVDWDTTKNKDMDVTQTGNGYSASLVRAKLIGYKSDYPPTIADEDHAGVDAASRYTMESCVAVCFPKNLLMNIRSKYMEDNLKYSDSLWLLSPSELNCGQAAVYDNSITLDAGGVANSTRSSGVPFMTRTPADKQMIWEVDADGSVDKSSFGIDSRSAIAPGFVLAYPQPPIS